MSQPPYPYYRIFDFESFSIVNPTTQQPGVQIEGELDAIKRTLDSLMSRLAEIQRDDGYIRDSALDESTIIPYFYDKLFILFQPVFLGKAGGEMDDTAVIAWIQNSLSSFDSSKTDTISTAVKLDGVKVEGAQWYEAEAQYLQEWDSEFGYWEGGLYKDVVTSEVKKGSIQLTRVGIGMNADLPAEVIELGKITLSTGGPISPVSGGIFPAAGVEAVSPHIKITDLNNGSISISPYGIFWPDGTLQTTRGIPQNEMGQYVEGAISAAISTLVGGAPAFLDTLSEIADAINNDSEIASTLADSIATKLSIIDAALAYYPVTNPSGYITSSALSGLLTQTAADGLYYPLGNPSGYITTSALSVYLTSATAATTYFPIPTGDTTQYIAGDGTLQPFPTLATANKLTAIAYNQTGSTLTKGTVVYISGAHGNLPTISKAQANAESTSAGTYGLVVADIANASSGSVIIAGLAENLNTSGYVDGNILYLSPTVAGGWTTTKPVAPNHMVYLGVVTRSHPNLGTVQLRVANGFELDELHDVLITSKTNNDLLAYESSTGLWKNKSFSTLGLLPSSTASLTYQTIVGMSSYLTTATAASTYYPLSNPSNFVIPNGTTSIQVTGGTVRSYDGSDNFVSLDGYSLNFGNGSTISGLSVTGIGITFADSTTQTTAGIGDAPSDSQTYGRNNGAWTVVSGGGGGGSGTLTYSSPYIYDTATASNINVLDLTSGSLNASTVTGGNSQMDATGLVLTPSSGAVITFTDGTTQSSQSHDVPTGGTTGQVLTKNSATDYDASWATPSGGGGGVDVQTFGSSTTSGTFTWTKPANAKWVEVYLYAGGGGGGSGTRQATTAVRFGGGGGSGGTVFYGRISANYLNSTQNVVVGVGGMGGASVSVNTTNGNSGLSGTDTTFSIFRSAAGAGGAGATTTAAAGGGARSSMVLASTFTQGSGAAGANTFGNGAFTIPNAYYIPNGGGGGAGNFANTLTAKSGGAGGNISVSTTTAGLISAIAGGAGGTTTGVQATAGTSATTQQLQGGTGGGGGFYMTGVAGGTGGKGGWPGGGGGGGGASDNGFNSGAGGNGANGVAVIITYF